MKRLQSPLCQSCTLTAMDRPNGSLSVPMTADAYQVSLDASPTASPCPTSPSPKSIKSSRSRGRRNSNAFAMQSDVPELSSPQDWNLEIS